MAKTSIKVGFRDQVKSADVELPEGEAKPWDADAKLDVVGKPLARRDGSLKVSGRAKYTYDISLPGMLHAAVVRSVLPAAKVLSVDTSAAEKIQGVKAVLTVAEEGDSILFAGQDIAAVVAERPEQAWQAAKLVKVEYEQRKFVTRLAFAATPDAPQVHREAVEERQTEGHVTAGGGGEAKGNVRPLRPMQKGDIDKGLAGATVHEAVYETQVQTHSALETHGIVARWDDDEHLTVWASTQSIFSVRDELAEVLGLKPANVRVHTDHVGGGFGAKFGASAPGSRLGTIAAKLAKKAGAPVKLMCDRHEEQVCTGNRPDSIQTVKVAGKKDGSLTAIHVKSLGTAGIGTGAGVGRNAFAVYTKCPNILIDSSDVFTNAGPGTAMRAPGHPQGAFAFELAIDELAVKLGVDPIKLRLANDEHPVRLWQFEDGAKRFDWDAKRAESKKLREGKARIRRGYGVAASIWGDFGRPKAAVVTCSVMRDGSIEIRNGVQDIGTGIATVLAQIGAEVFARPLDTIVVRYGDSEFGSSVGSGGSQTTSSVTPAVRNACEDAKTKLIAHAAEVLKAKPAEVTWSKDMFSAGERQLTFAQVCRKIEGESITATSTRPRTYGAHPVSFLGAPMPQIAGVQFAEVEIDTWTGVVRAKHILAMHDCGRVMNRLTCTSQINGGVILGTSYALMEQRVMDHDVGRMLNPNLDSYKICGAADTPEIEIELTDVYTGANNTGAAGIGEPSTIPTAAALACAVFDALGEPVRRLPMTPSRVLTAMGLTKGLG